MDEVQLPSAYGQLSYRMTTTWYQCFPTLPSLGWWILTSYAGIAQHAQESCGDIAEN